MTNTLHQEYRVLSDAEKGQIKTMKDAAQIWIDGLDSLGQSREFSLAKTKIEEAVMWAVKGITG